LTDLIILIKAQKNGLCSILFGFQNKYIVYTESSVFLIKIYDLNGVEKNLIPKWENRASGIRDCYRRRMIVSCFKKRSNKMNGVLQKQFRKNKNIFKK